MTALLTKRPDNELAHLAWCILVAVSLARREGKARSSLATHMFIMQWLSTAQKRKLFPKTLAQDIIWLQNEGKRYGPDARLYSKIEYVWLASSGRLASQSTLFRFTCMIDTLRTMGWQDHLLSDDEWDIGWNTGTEISAIYTQKSRLHSSFSQKGELIAPMEIRLTGDISGLPPLLKQCCLRTDTLPAAPGYSSLQLLPDVPDTTSDHKI